MLPSDSIRLPAGMRDFMPAAATARRRLAEALVAVFEGGGYARVITPAFEYEDVLARGLGSAGRAAAVRFVEPSSGQVVALRPDITPQIARLVATHYREERGPLRLCYEGTVIRWDARARAQREIIQAGVELCGVGGAEGDAEAVALGVAALRAIGHEQPTIDVGHLGLVREVQAALALPEDALASVRARIAKRDAAGLAAVLAESGASAAAARFAARLPAWRGDARVVAAARKAAPTPGIRAALDDLDAVMAVVGKLKLPARVRADLGEVRGFDYYTGVRFQGFVDGAAEAVLQGGRYDDLLGRYGRARPAVGFAIDVEAAAGALERGRAFPGGGSDRPARKGGGR